MNNADLIITTDNNTDLRDMFDNIDFDEESIENINKNDMQKTNICINCNKDNLIEDFSMGIIVCKSCGQVQDNIIDSQPEWRTFDDSKEGNIRCSSNVSKLLPQSSLGTTIRGGRWNSRIKTLHNWSAMPYRERSLNGVFKQLQEVCEKNGIFKCIEDDAKIMYKAISECKHAEGKNIDKFIIIRGKNRVSLIAACIFFACKRKGMTRSPKEIADIFKIDYTDITRGCKNFQKFIKKGNIDINMGLSLPEDFVSRFCKELNIMQKYIDHAVVIAKNIRQMNFASVHTPFSIATSSILLMAEFNDISSITKKKLASRFGVSEVTITKTYKKIEEYKDILGSQDKVNDYIKNKLINAVNNKISDILSIRFEKFGIPMDKEELSNFKYKYSNIFKDDSAIIIKPKNNKIKNNIDTEQIIKLKIRVKRLSKKIKSNLLKLEKQII